MRRLSLRTFKVIFIFIFFLSTFVVTFAQEKEPLLVGSIWDQVGFGGTIGQICLKGSQLAVDLVNEAGGIYGRKVEYINIDGQSELDVIAGAAKRLAEERKVLAAIGSEDDSLTSASGPVFQANGTVFLTGPATTPTQPEIGEYIFMPAYGDHFQGTAAAKFCAEELGWKKIAVLYDAASAYSVYLSKAFQEAFRYFTNDPTAIVQVESYMTGDMTFTAQLTRIRGIQDKIDAFVTFPPEPQDAPVYSKQARSLGITVPLFFTDGGDDMSVVEVGGDAVEGAYISTQFAGDAPTTEIGKQFVLDYNNKFGEEPGCFESIGYDSMRLVLESIDAIIGIVGDEVWDSMTLVQKRTAIRNTLQLWPAFQTTIVPISYPDPEKAIYPRVPNRPVIFKQIKNEELRYYTHMEPEEIADHLTPVLEAMGAIKK
ncbi:MAG: ABC transporter substrate-binding protein [Atribacterota bacterium]|jgi:branched-chain amino acid transport system substrate-binding protein|nr:ABC transporter substrate-binding protein [Atribacterota bacterium]MDD4895974.1 ABC transporter substrate-binding protein [Atribacterota bacterium]MDD5636948.1 ABC transporter substrate-binding protein [Atribacterota bacterium]